MWEKLSFPRKADIPLKTKKAADMKNAVLSRPSMKKRVIKSFALAGVMIAILAGCADVDINVKIDEAGTADYTYQTTVAREDVDSSGMVTADEYLAMIKESEGAYPEGINTEVIDEGGKIGNIISVKGEYDSEGFTFLKEQGLVELSASADDMVTVTIPVATLLEAYGVSEKAAFKAMFKSFNVVVEFPGNITEVSSDGKVEGNKVTWTAEQVYNAVVANESLIVKGSQAPSGPPMLLIAFGLIGLLVLAGGGFFGWKKFQEYKTNKLHQNIDNVNEEDAAYYAQHPEERPQDDDEPYNPANNTRYQVQQQAPTSQEERQGIYEQGYREGYSKGVADTESNNAQGSGNPYVTTPQAPTRRVALPAPMPSQEQSTAAQQPPAPVQHIEAPTSRPRPALPPLPQMPPRRL